MTLHQLTYCSTFSDVRAPEIDVMLGNCRPNNRRRNISGILYFDGTYFLQVLEGSRDVLTKTFVTIASDARHHGVELVNIKPIDERQYKNFDMKYVTWSKESRLKVTQFTDARTFNPYRMSRLALEKFALEYCDFAS